MIDPISISALILAVISGIAVFIKGIKKCRISSKGMVLERETQNSELAKQQEFTLKLIELMNALPTKDEESDIQSISEITQEKTPQINEKLKNIMDILERKPNNNSFKEKIKSSVKKKANKSVTTSEKPRIDPKTFTVDITKLEYELQRDLQRDLQRETDKSVKKEIVKDKEKEIEKEKTFTSFIIKK
jgi:hypothetical protein